MSEVTTQDGTILVRPVLFCAPVLWTEEFWAASAHAWDWVRPETPLDQKPWAELDVSLDVTLGESFEVACDAWGIKLGTDWDELRADPDEYRDVRRHEFHRFAFVRPDHPSGVSDQGRYGGPPELPIAREDGSVEWVFGRDVTYRELLVASSLGLIEGDVKRPYVHPVSPQGDGFVPTELVKLTAEAIRAAYEAVDDAGGYVEHTIRLIRASAPAVHRVAGEAVDDGVRLVALYAAYRWVRGKLRRRRDD